MFREPQRAVATAVSAACKWQQGILCRGGVRMSIGRVLGAVLLIGGVVLIIVGVVESRSLANSLSSIFTGRLTQHTMLYIFGGIASAVVGLILTAGVFRRAR